MKAKKWITNNLGLKILSLVLAITTWFYITWEFTKLKTEEEKAIFSMLHYEVISKRLPIQLTIVGEAREGYEIITGDISIDPESCVVIGPENIVREIDVARTTPIEISEHTKDINKQIGLAPIAKGIKLQDSFVKVHIPIAKKVEKSEPQE
jgi:YbbR domain-containing protein